MPSDISAILARITANIAVLPRVGNVYSSEQLVFDQETLAAVAGYTDSVDGDVLRFWQLHSENPTTQWADSSGRLEWWRRITIEGRLQWSNGTDQTASSIIATSLGESIIRALATDPKLGGTVLDSKVARILTNAPQVFAGFMVMHYVALELRVLTIE